MLEGLAVESDRRLAAGDPASAVELIGLVRTHPSAVATCVALVESTLDRCALPTEEMTAALARGAALDLDAAVGEIRADLEADETDP